MTIALTRDVSPEIVNCELTFLARQTIDPVKASTQHAAYRTALQELGLTVHNLANPEHLPDAVFVEDPAVILDEVAVVTRMGSASRQAEVESFAKVIETHRPIVRIQSPGTLEGGDVLRVGKTLYVGLSSRTNQSGAKQLERFVQAYGYEVKTAEVLGCLHFKTGCSYIGNDTVLINSAWVNAAIFSGYKLIEVYASEPFAANAILIGETLLYSTSFPKTQALLKSRGFRLKLVDISELMKAEAGLTCMSQIFSE